MRVQCSMAYFATRPEWYAVPQATMKILSTSRRSCSDRRISSSISSPVSPRRPRRVSATARGCSRDLLEHEVVVAALLSGGGVPVDVVVLADGVVSLEVCDLDPLGGDQDDLVLAQLHRLPRVLDEGGHVAGEVVLPLPPADHEGRVAPGSYDGAGGVRVDGEQGEGALQAQTDPAHGLGERVRTGMRRLGTYGGAAPPRAGAPRTRCRCRSRTRHPRPPVRTAAGRSSR